MIDPVEFEYTVLLIFPGFGPERENAEDILELALEWLNANKLEPGFRFNPVVGARLEVVSDAETARERVEADDAVALVVMHDLDDDERDELRHFCAERQVSACYTIDVPRRTGPRKATLRLVLGKKTAEPPAHRLTAATLTDPVADDRPTADRVGDAIAVLALGVMAYHWHKNPQQWPPLMPMDSR